MSARWWEKAVLHATSQLHEHSRAETSSSRWIRPRPENILNFRLKLSGCLHTLGWYVVTFDDTCVHLKFSKIVSAYHSQRFQLRVPHSRHPAQPQDRAAIKWIRGEAEGCALMSCVKRIIWGRSSKAQSPALTLLPGFAFLLSWGRGVWGKARKGMRGGYLNIHSHNRI